MAHPARWLLPHLDRGAIEALAKELGLGIPTTGVVYTRGFGDGASGRRWLCPPRDDLHDPMAMRGMDCALERLLRAIRDREKILIYGDYDVDGTTSVVVLKRAIELAGGAADFHVPDRLKEGYGVRPQPVGAAAAPRVFFVIPPHTRISRREVVL